MKTIIALGLFVAAVASTTIAKDQMTESLRPLKGEEFDQAFLSQMIEHHKQGVEMAQLAQRHARSSEVKQFAEKTAQMQQKDIHEMKSMLGASSSHHASSTSASAGARSGSASHHSTGSAHHAMSTEHDQIKKETMSKLEAAQGSEFDKVFVAEMLKHHEMAKGMAELAKSRSSRDDVRAFASKTVKQQEQDSRELKKLKS